MNTENESLPPTEPLPPEWYARARRLVNWGVLRGLIRRPDAAALPEDKGVHPLAAAMRAKKERNP